MTLSFEDFKKLDIRIGKILSAEAIERSDKLVKLIVDIGNEKRVLVAGIADVYEIESLVGKQIPVVTNLKPKRIWGVLSRGMILAVDVDSKPVLMHPDREVPVGSVVK
ncbi:MAG TPA: methionine--tRNA ligase subunit beta [Candidatus Altiarchaeales archaeon]|nr:methionine--tRNA ligase subunit beta [Candidatus Altiarchaeales archaeon]